MQPQAPKLNAIASRAKNTHTGGGRPRTVAESNIIPASAILGMALSDGVSWLPTAAASSGGRSGS